MSTIINPLSEALKLKPAANRQRMNEENEENRKRQWNDFYREQGASNAQIKKWRILTNSERSKYPPWEVVLSPTPPSSPPPKFKPTPPPYPRGKRPQVTGEDPINPTLGGGKKTRRKRSNLKQKSRMVNKKNKSKRNRRK